MNSPWDLARACHHLNMPTADLAWGMWRLALDLASEILVRLEHHNNLDEAQAIEQTYELIAATLRNTHDPQANH
jgi:hypothetical protein